MSDLSAPAPPRAPLDFTALVNRHQGALFGFLCGLLPTLNKPAISPRIPFTTPGVPPAVKSHLSPVMARQKPYAAGSFRRPTIEPSPSCGDGG